jgi:hypothetical protein
VAARIPFTYPPLLAAAAIVGLLSPGEAAPSSRVFGRPSGTAIEYRLESLPDAVQDLSLTFTPSQRALLQKLNRADGEHMRNLEWLVVPAVWRGELEYSPFPGVFPAAVHTPTLLVVDQPWQAFAAYEYGSLVRWGPVSSGSRTSPTPPGLFHLNWRSRGRHSTVNPRWFLKWYFNFQNALGLSLHAYGLPGYPASHGCIRLLERDAVWIYEWGRSWTVSPGGRIVARGTPLLVIGQYQFGGPPPWRSLEHLANGIKLPEDLPRETGFR